jgi:hypothetical protein
MHCEIVSVRKDDIGVACRLEDAFRCLGALRQTALILEFRANKKERPAVAPDACGRAKSEPGVPISLSTRLKGNPDIHLL